jgi:hypothetical protein
MLLSFIVPLVFVSLEPITLNNILILNYNNPSKEMMSTYNGYLYKTAQVGHVDKYSISVEARTTELPNSKPYLKANFDLELKVVQRLRDGNYTTCNTLSNIVQYPETTFAGFRSPLQFTTYNKYNQIVSSLGHDLESSVIHSINVAKYNMSFVNRYLLKKQCGDVKVQKTQDNNWEVLRVLEGGISQPQPTILAYTKIKLCAKSGELMAIKVEATSKDDREKYILKVIRK